MREARRIVFGMAEIGVANGLFARIPHGLWGGLQGERLSESVSDHRD